MLVDLIKKHIIKSYLFKTLKKHGIDKKIWNRENKKLRAKFEDLDKNEQDKGFERMLLKKYLELLEDKRGKK